MDLGQRIHQCYQKGLTREETFHRICIDMNLPQVSAKQLAEWFRNIDTQTEELAFPDNYSHYTVLMRIAEELDKLQNVIAIWNRADISYQMLQFLNSRYALAFSGYDLETNLWLLDNFHGQKR
jgi:hypothetical protein